MYEFSPEILFDFEFECKILRFWEKIYINSAWTIYLKFYDFKYSTKVFVCKIQYFYALKKMLP